MKKLLAQIGKAFSYFMVYFGWQTILSVVLLLEYYVIRVVAVAMKTNGDTSGIDSNQLMNDAITDITDILTIFTMIMVLLTLWGIYKVMQKKVKEELLLCPISPRNWFGVLLVAVGIYMVISFGLDYLPFSEEVWESYAEASSVLMETDFLMVVATVICAPVMEEIVFRALIFGRLMKGMPVWLAAILSSLVFGVMHGQILWMTYTFALGLTCCYVMHKTGSVYAGILVHMFFNLFGGVLNVYVALLPPSYYLGALIVGALILIVGIIWLWPVKAGGVVEA